MTEWALREAGDAATRGEFGKAIEVLEGVIREGSCREAGVYETLAQCYLATDRPDDAYGMALQATRLAPEWADSHLTCARAARNAGYGLRNAETSLKGRRYGVEAVVEFGRAYALERAESTALELQEARELRCRAIAERVGIAGLRIEERFGAGQGPGGVIWDCALVLIDTLKSMQDPIAGTREREADRQLGGLIGKRVLELGSGTGVVGIVCSCLGGDVTLTDRTEQLQLTQTNAEMNQNLIIQHHGCCHCTVHPKPRHQGAPSFHQVLDWEAPAEGILDGPWDCVVGADLVYSVGQIGILVELLKGLQERNPQCQMLLAHKCRNEAVDTEFYQKLRELGIVPKGVNKDRSPLQILSRNLF